MSSGWVHTLLCNRTMFLTNLSSCSCPSAVQNKAKFVKNMARSDKGVVAHPDGSHDLVENVRATVLGGGAGRRPESGRISRRGWEEDPRVIMCWASKAEGESPTTR